MKFTKGQSGNPKGRPPKKRALTTLLETMGSKKFAGTSSAQKRAFVERLWQGLTTGVISFPAVGEQPARALALDASDYIALARLVFNQIDGPPKGELDVTSDGQAVGITFNYIPSRSEAEREAADLHLVEKGS